MQTIGIQIPITNKDARDRISKIHKQEEKKLHSKTLKTFRKINAIYKSYENPIEYKKYDTRT